MLYEQFLHFLEDFPIFPNPCRIDNEETTRPFKARRQIWSSTRMPGSSSSHAFRPPVPERIDLSYEKIGENHSENHQKLGLECE